MNLDEREDREAAAGEYVIGTLEADERRQFESQLVSDPDLASLVARWQDHLLPLTRRVEPVEPSVGLWQRIVRSLDEAEATAPTRDARISASPLTGSSETSRERSASAPSRGSLWDSLRLWRGVSALAVAASLVLSSILIFRPPEVQVYYAVLRSPADQVGWLIQARSAGTLRLVPLEAAQPVPAGKALELWTKAEGAAGPTSLGLIQPDQAIEIPTNQLPALGRNQLFEITVEPATGSPIGKPTGPVLFIGRTEGI